MSHQTGPNDDYRWLKRFETLVMRPLDVGLLVAAVVLCVNGTWTTGCMLFVIGLLLGAIGQGPPHHRRQATADLRHPGIRFRDALESNPAGVDGEELSG